jgi:hypothetical protein
MRREFFSVLLIVWSSLTAVKAESREMKQYTVALPNYVLGISLPAEIVHGDVPIKHMQRFDAQSPDFLKSGFDEVFAAMYDVKGPIWVGAYGSLILHVSVKRKEQEIGGGIESVDALTRYIEKWRKSFPPGAVSRSSLNGIPAVKSVRSNAGETGRAPSSVEIYSIPLNDEVFLEISFRVTQWDAGRSKQGKWRPKVDAAREFIESSIVLEAAK